MKLKIMTLMWFITMMTGCVPHHQHTHYDRVYAPGAQQTRIETHQELELKQRIYDQEDKEDYAEQAGTATGALFGVFLFPFLLLMSVGVL